MSYILVLCCNYAYITMLIQMRFWSYIPIPKHACTQSKTSLMSTVSDRSAQPMFTFLYWPFQQCLLVYYSSFLKIVLCCPSPGKHFQSLKTRLVYLSWTLMLVAKVSKMFNVYIFSNLQFSGTCICYMWLNYISHTETKPSS